MIPSQLKDGTWRFLLVKPQDKKAFEKNWETTANYGFDDPKLLEHLGKGGNYGVLPGTDHIIVETDTPELEALIEKSLPPTFTQRSPGHQTKQFFYKGAAKQTYPLFDKSRAKDKQNIGHVKWGGSYVVGPGSTHPNKGKYEVIDDLPVTRITEEEILGIITPFLAHRASVFERTEASRHGVREEFSLLDILSIGQFKQAGDRLQGSHPVHGSSTGMNFSVDTKKNVWHCFRCCSGGGPWQLLAVIEGIIDCGDSVPGGLRGERFRQTLEKARERGLIKQVPGAWTPPVPSAYESEEFLFNALVSFLKRYIFLKDERVYTVLAAWSLATWLRDNWRVTPPVYVLGPINSGKTVVLECLEQITQWAIRAGSMSTAVMFRLDELHHPTFLLDESHVYDRDEMAEVQSIINERYRYGGKVWRMVGEGKSMTPTAFNVYGFTAFASHRPPWDALSSRSLLIQMQKNRRRVERTLTAEFEETGKKLQAWLAHYQETHKKPSRTLIIDLKADEQLEQLQDYRSREIGFPLLAVAPSSACDGILEYLKELEKEHQAEEQTSQPADYVVAIGKCEPEKGIISYHAISFQLKILWNTEKDPHSLTIRKVCRTLGFKFGRTNTLRGIIHDSKLLEELMERYVPPSPLETVTGVTTVTLNTKGSDSSDSSDGSPKVGSPPSGYGPLYPSYPPEGE